MDKMKSAIEEVRFLLDRGYRKVDSVRFVSDHYKLSSSEKHMLYSMAYSENDITATVSKTKGIEYVKDNPLVIDGFNVLTIIESAFEKNEAFVCQDGITRAKANLVSTYKIRETTMKAADKVIELLKLYPPRRTQWVFDSQISGSGKLSEYIMEKLKENGLPGESVTTPSAYSHITKVDLLTATSDHSLIEKLTAIVDLPSAVLAKE